jgi:phosphoglycolate phosphatase
MTYSADKLVILDADGTLVDAFRAMEMAFALHEMDIGDLERFQKRRKLFKYLGGLREFPKNLRKQFGKQSRKRLLDSLTDIYREEARLYPGFAALLKGLIAAPHIRVGIVSRNITHEPEQTFRLLLARHGIDATGLDFICCLPLREDKCETFKKIRRELAINPACCFVCGDEFRDYTAATGAGMHPFIASYGFEDYERLSVGFDVPVEVISRTPAELIGRLSHALNVSLAAAPDSARLASIVP